ncbi:hypothetical protein CORC01_06748 [Colletotrichum orchidophilum]|uniref:Uncharacterized protein n=1 Tax=Colletotrichum orchidophilum TaxID=1209926 RepID=A0A1G4B993_9PEZI|nr:uncharacterized protein CORC01_06748 [Colletotrichum orchidophilum]OHE97885.1 hypothetical protein CORC01_06748 [Colletotrichum orchidophilum]
MPFFKHEQIVDKSFEQEGNTTPGEASGGNERVSNESDIEPGVRVKPSGRHETQPTDRISGHQIFYIFGLDGIGAGVLSGGINFAIAYGKNSQRLVELRLRASKAGRRTVTDTNHTGMYSTQNIERNPIRLFQLPNTLAGDAVVTTVIQTAMTWFIEFILANHDIKNGAVRPIGFIREPSHPFLRWFMMLDQEDAAHTKSRLTMFSDHIIRIGLIFVVSFILLWPASVGILTTIGHRGSGSDWDWYFHRKWAPEIFKGVYGGLLGLLTTPAMASFWLVREGWRLKRGGSLLS